MKVEHEAKLDRNEMSMFRWMCGFNMKDNEKNTDIKGLFGLDPISLTIKRSRLRWLDMLRGRMMQTGSNDV